MRVTVMQGGGLVGLVRTTWVDSASLAPEDADMLWTMVNAAGPFDSSPAVGSGTDYRDIFNYAVIIEDANRHQTVLVSGEALSAGLRALILWVLAAPGRHERLGVPGEDIAEV